MVSKKSTTKNFSVGPECSCELDFGSLDLKWLGLVFYYIVTVPAGGPSKLSFSATAEKNFKISAATARLKFNKFQISRAVRHFRVQSAYFSQRVKIGPAPVDL